MADHNALVSRLSAVETLGATTIIFTDKTGTLTENRMRVRRFILSGQEVEVKENRAQDVAQNAVLQQILQVGVLCNNASLDNGKEMGDPTETALLRIAEASEIHRNKLLEEYPEMREEAFRAETKMMGTFHEQKGEILVAVKGAPEAVLKCCTHMADGEKLVELSQDEHRKWEDKNLALAEEGMRLIAMAHKTAATKDDDPYQGLTLLGFAALHDPPREDVRKALEECATAGIRVIMVTGDHPATARGIATAVGLASAEDTTLNGDVIQHPEALSPQERE